MRSQRRIGFSFDSFSFNAAEEQVVFPGAVKVKKTIPAVPATQRDKVLTTRTNESNGVITAGTNHTIENTQVVDVYWAAGRRFGMDATVDNLAVTVVGGSGDNLPVVNTNTMSLMQQVEMPEAAFIGNNARVFGTFYKNPGSPTAKAHVDFQNSDDASIEDFDLVEEKAHGSLDHIVNVDKGDTNPFASNTVEEAYGSHDAATAGELYILVGQGTS